MNQVKRIKLPFYFPIKEQGQKADTREKYIWGKFTLPTSVMEDISTQWLSGKT